jgi:hypothetical protein
MVRGSLSPTRGQPLEEMRASSSDPAKSPAAVAFGVPRGQPPFWREGSSANSCRENVRVSSRCITKIIHGGPKNLEQIERCTVPVWSILVSPTESRIESDGE